MSLRGVIFDLGNTLVHYHPDVEQAGADGLRAFFIECGHPVPDVDEARRRSFAVIERHWQRLKNGEMDDYRARTLLAHMAAAWGLPEAAFADETLLDAALWAYYTPMSRQLTPKPGARETLAAVRERGLRVGLVSNTTWPGDFLRGTLAELGLAQYLECALFSADEDAWKPDPEIFRRALRALDLQPGEAAYVGDSLFFDVQAAQQVGMKGVLVGEYKWLQAYEAEGVQHVRPDATLAALPDLLETLAPWL